MAKKVRKCTGWFGRVWYEIEINGDTERFDSPKEALVASREHQAYARSLYYELVRTGIPTEEMEDVYLQMSDGEWVNIEWYYDLYPNGDDEPRQAYFKKLGLVPL
jgi:hypothetical protein